MGKVSIVIPNFNGVQILQENLPSIIKAKENSVNEILEIIVVDDGSTDESVKVIGQKFPEIRVIKHRINRGFSAAVNTGARMTRGSLICLLNTDVKVTDFFLEKVIPHFSDKKIFGVSLHEATFGWSKGIFQDGFIIHSPGIEDDKSHETFWISGGSGVFRREIWMELGGMDQELLPPFYWEDIDLSYRAQKRGYKLIWEPNSLVVHQHEATISKISKRYTDKIWERNQLLFIWKNLTSKNLFNKHLTGLLKRIVKSPGYLIVFFMALIKFRQIIKLRLKEKRESKISDEAIFSKFR